MSDYLRGEKTIDPNRNRNLGSSIFQLRLNKSFAIQCSSCGKWRKISTKNLINYNFRCFSCNKSGGMRANGVYQFNYKLLPEGIKHDTYVKALNDNIR